MNETMATDGGMLHVPARPDQPARLCCPVLGCAWFAELTDLGQFVHVGISEDDVRQHLGRHTVEQWLRTVAAAREDVARAERATPPRANVVPRCCAMEAAHLGGATRAQSVAVLKQAEASHARH